MESLHISLKTTHLGRKPSTFISSSTHTFQVFLFLPLHLTPATSPFLQVDTQSSTLLRSRSPNQLNLSRLTTSAALLIDIIIIIIDTLLQYSSPLKDAFQMTPGIC